MQHTFLRFLTGLMLCFGFSIGVLSSEKTSDQDFQRRYIELKEQYLHAVRTEFFQKSYGSESNENRHEDFWISKSNKLKYLNKNGKVKHFPKVKPEEILGLAKQLDELLSKNLSIMPQFPNKTDVGALIMSTLVQKEHNISTVWQILQTSPSSLIYLDRQIGGKRLTILNNPFIEQRLGNEKEPGGIVCAGPEFFRYDFFNRTEKVSSQPLNQSEIREMLNSDKLNLLGEIQQSGVRPSSDAPRFLFEIRHVYYPAGEYDGYNAVYVKGYFSDGDIGCFTADVGSSHKNAVTVFYFYPGDKPVEGEPTEECNKQLTDDPKSAQTPKFISCMQAAIPKSPKFIDLVKKLEKFLSEDLKLKDTKLEFVPAK